MRKFDGKDPITWILQMEQFFDLHNVPHTQNVQIASLYLEPNQFVWYRWLCSRKSLITRKPGKVISSNDMTKLLKKGHQDIIAQLFSLDVQTSKPSIPQDTPKDH
jgi:hypothetical protein